MSSAFVGQSLGSESAKFATFFLVIISGYFRMATEGNKTVLVRCAAKVWARGDCTPWTKCSIGRFSLANVRRRIVIEDQKSPRTWQLIFLLLGFWIFDWCCWACLAESLQQLTQLCMNQFAPTWGVCDVLLQIVQARLAMLSYAKLINSVSKSVPLLAGLKFCLNNLKNILKDMLKNVRSSTSPASSTCCKLAAKSKYLLRWRRCSTSAAVGTTEVGNSPQARKHSPRGPRYTSKAVRTESASKKSLAKLSEGSQVSTCMWLHQPNLLTSTTC